MIKRALLSICILTGLVPACFGEPVFHVDCFFGWDGCFRPMEWTTVNVQIDSALTEPFAGMLTVSAQQDGLNNMIINTEFVLTPGVRKQIPLVTKLAYGAEKCSVRVSTAKGKTVWSSDYSLWDYTHEKQTLNSLSENDLLIGLVGHRKFGILKLEEEAACRFGESIGKVYVKDKLISQLPWDWTGYCGLDILVLYDPDLTLCSRPQLLAMEQWVRNGGKILMILSSNPLTDDNPLRGCLPFEILPSRQYELTGTIASEFSLSAYEQQVVAWPIKANPSVLCDFSPDDSSICLFGVGYCGFGRIGVLSFDPATLSNPSQTTPFWIQILTSVIVDPALKALEPERPQRDTEQDRFSNYHQMQYELHKIQATSVREIIPVEPKQDDEEPTYFPHYYGISLEQAASNSVMEYLLSIPQMRPLSIWWVILLLVLLGLLLGPVDYIVLKKLDKQPLTWLTCTFWIVLFTVAAYYGVQALRSGQLQYRSVTVVDSTDTDYTTWSATHAGIFAPRSDKYQLEGLTDTQWWSAVSPEQREIYSYNRQNATRNIYCMQYDGSNIPYALPVNIWTMQCLLCEQPQEMFPLRASVKRSGNQIQVKLSNLSDQVFEKGYVLINNNRLLEFGRVEPVATMDVEGLAKTAMVWETGSDQNNYDYSETLKYTDPVLNSEEAYIAKGSLNRTKSLRAMIERGAAVVCVEVNTVEPTIRIKDKECEYTNRKLYRLVVFPEE